MMMMLAILSVVSADKFTDIKSNLDPGTSIKTTTTKSSKKPVHAGQHSDAPIHSVTTEKTTAVKSDNSGFNDLEGMADNEAEDPLQADPSITKDPSTSASAANQAIVSQNEIDLLKQNARRNTGPNAAEQDTGCLKCVQVGMDQIQGCLKDLCKDPQCFEGCIAYYRDIETIAMDANKTGSGAPTEAGKSEEKPANGDMMLSMGYVTMVVVGATLLQ